MAAVEHHHTALVNLGCVEHAVEQGLVAIGAAQFYAHSVAHTAGECVLVAPIALGRSAQIHDIVARHAAVWGNIVDQRVVLVAVGRVEDDAV